MSELKKRWRCQSDDNGGVSIDDVMDMNANTFDHDDIND